MDLPLMFAAEEVSLLASLGGTLWNILSVAAGLGFVIFVHELGHFLVAKACGVKCEKFYVGFDFFELKLGPITIPRSLVKFTYGETEYGIGILPLGGYVKMLGQDDDPRNAEAEAERIKAQETGTAVPSEATAKTSEKVALDPRSYPAKSVPARMAIISAGVIMNLIFGVLLGGTAYWLGVRELPATVGVSIPGEPAWAAGLRTDDRALQFGKSGSPYEHLRYNDLQRSVIFNGVEKDLDVLVRRADGTEEWLSMRPRLRDQGTGKQATIGVKPTSNLTILMQGALPTSAKSSEPLLEGDEITHVDGTEVKNYGAFVQTFASKPSGPIGLTIRRTPKSEDGKPSGEPTSLEVTIPERGENSLGLVPTMGLVVSVRKGSPAETAGILVGDKLLTIEGEKIENPLALSQQLLPHVGKEITIEVERAATGDQRVVREVKITPVAPPMFSTANFATSIAAEPIGVAVKLDRTIAAADESSKLAAGDKIDKVTFEFADKDREKLFLNYLTLKTPEVILDDTEKNLVYLQGLLRLVPLGTKATITASRGGDKPETITSQPVEVVSSETLLDESRGITTETFTTLHQAKSVGEALALGAREIKERVTEVLTVLQKLVTLQISPTNLSGPLGILGAAGSHASAGIPILLLFLTMLSANLAVINFLPIPALDGGHMLFLAAEWIRGKPVNEQLQVRLTVMGILFLLSLMIFATAMDLSRISQFFF